MLWCGQLMYKCQAKLAWPWRVETSTRLALCSVCSVWRVGSQTSEQQVAVHATHTVTTVPIHSVSRRGANAPLSHVLSRCAVGTHQPPARDAVPVAVPEM